MAKRNCPYCAHPNATEAKFCVACGAAMHLAPCPHCGSINHINVEKCYRCGGDLPKQEILEGDPEAAPATESTAPLADGGAESTVSATHVATVEDGTAQAGHAPPTVLVRQADAQGGRPSLAVMFIIICSFVFAGLYAARFRASESKDDAAKAAGRTPAPATVPAPVQPPAPAAALPQDAKPVSPAGKVEPPAEPAKPAPAPKPAAKPLPAEPPAKPTAPVTPCTEAVAALGLCKLETK